MTYNNVIFYNPYHNGDVHGSRTFVKYIVEHCQKNNIKCHYIHENKYSLIKDIENLNIIIKPPHLPHNNLAFVSNGDLYINTWYAAGNHKYLSRYNCSFNCYYHLFNDVLQQFFNTNLEKFSNKKEDFFPDIDFSKYNVSNIEEWLKNNVGYKVLICNCDTKSGQSNNFDFNPIIEDLSTTYSDVTWILTDVMKYRIKKQNVFYSCDIINNKGDDLNENGYLSCFCDYLIGRNSGAFSFFYNKKNFFNSNKNILSFLIHNSAVYPCWYELDDFKLNYTCNIFDSREESTDNVKNTIQKYLRK